MTPWSHCISLLPMYDALWFQALDAAGWSDKKKLYKCASCAKEPSFYASWFYFTSRSPESTRTSSATKALCGQHAASLAAKYSASLKAHVAQGQYIEAWALPEMRTELSKGVLDAYEAKTGLDLPVVGGKRLLPVFINALIAIDNDPDKCISGLLLGSERSYVDNKRSPSYVYDGYLVREMQMRSWLFERPAPALVGYKSVTEPFSYLRPLRSGEWALTPAAQKIVEMIRSTVGGLVP